MSKCQFFHQCGHNDVWNRDTYDEGVGYGLILSPVNMPRNKIENLSSDLKKDSLFDPQFYLPSSSRPKLLTYEFHPAIVYLQGSDTSDYLEDYSYDHAVECVEFQLQNEFDSIIVPARHSETFGDSYQRFNGHMYSTFLEVCSELDVNVPIYLTLPLHYSMIFEEKTVNDILNWVTSYTENQGIYLLCQKRSGSKQIKDSDFIENMLDICYSIKENDLSLIVGYCNTEGLLYSVAGADIIATGAYENLRMFSTDRWDEPEMRTGPKGRYYSPALLNWVESGYIGTMERRGILERIESENRYSNILLDPVFPWNFQRPEIYKHYFYCFDRQVEELSKLSLEERHNLLLRWIGDAIELYKEIGGARIMLDEDSGGDHLFYWGTALSGFADRRLGIR